MPQINIYTKEQVDALVGSGGDGWEELDLTNMPNDWSVGDIIKVEFFQLKRDGGTTPTSWTSTFSRGTPNGYGANPGQIIERAINNNDASTDLVNIINNANYISMFGYRPPTTTNLNSGGYGLIYLWEFNGADHGSSVVSITSSNYTSFISKIWRKKVSQ